MKKKIAVLLSTMLLLSVTPFGACGQNADGASAPQSAVKVEKGYLVLSTYNTKLKVGETLQLDVKKYNEKDVAQTIEKLEIVSECPTIVSVENGVLKAVAKGDTYVNVKADGLEKSVKLGVNSVGD